MAFKPDKIPAVQFDIREKENCKCKAADKEISSIDIKLYEYIYVQITGCQVFIEKERIRILKRANRKKRLLSYLYLKRKSND